MEAVIKVKSKLQAGVLTKYDLAIKLGMSRVTLDTRLEKNNWKKAELFLLKSIV